MIDTTKTAANLAMLTPRTREAMAQLIAQLVSAEQAGWHGLIGLSVTLNGGEAVRIGTAREETYQKQAGRS